jgi:hypothetical protein
MLERMGAPAAPARAKALFAAGDEEAHRTRETAERQEQETPAPRSDTIAEPAVPWSLPRAVGHPHADARQGARARRQTATLGAVLGVSASEAQGPLRASRDSNARRRFEPMAAGLGAGGEPMRRARDSGTLRILPLADGIEERFALLAILTDAQQRALAARARGHASPPVAAAPRPVSAPKPSLATQPHRGGSLHRRYPASHVMNLAHAAFKTVRRFWAEHPRQSPTVRWLALAPELADIRCDALAEHRLVLDLVDLFVAIKFRADPATAQAYVPDVLRCARGLPVLCAQATLLRATRAGVLALFPAPHPLPPEDASLCLRGPRDQPLAYVSEAIAQGDFP